MEEESVEHDGTTDEMSAHLRAQLSSVQQQLQDLQEKRARLVQLEQARLLTRLKDARLESLTNIVSDVPPPSVDTEESGTTSTTKVITSSTKQPIQVVSEESAVTRCTKFVEKIEVELDAALRDLVEQMDLGTPVVDEKATDKDNPNTEALAGLWDPCFDTMTEEPHNLSPYLTSASGGVIPSLPTARVFFYICDGCGYNKQQPSTNKRVQQTLFPHPFLLGMDWDVVTPSLAPNIGDVHGWLRPPPAPNWNDFARH
jgi:hypothetical protein